MSRHACLPLPFVLLALVILSGCVVTEHRDETLVVTNHWSSVLVPVGLGLAMLAAGVPMLAGWWRFKGKPRVIGAMLTLLGLLSAVGGSITVPFERTTIDRRQLVVERGMLGSGYTRTVDLTDLKAIAITKSRSGGRSRKGHGRRSTTTVQFIPMQGESQYVKLGGNQGAVALDYLLEQAPQRDIEIYDYRGD